MIRVSTKGRYGTRVMLELALHFEEGSMLLKDIAKKQEISEGYLEHIIRSLKAAGLVNSTRGAHGGYMLSRAPVQITLKEIVQVLEGSLALVECVTSPKVCHKVNFCVTREIWGEMTERMVDVLESTSLQDIVERHKQNHRIHSLMYSI